jgi:DNA primase
MAGIWIDFQELREKIDFSVVLKHFGVELKIKKGDQHQGFCPLPTHKGKRKSPSFSANLKRKIFHCFGCQNSGNCIDFVCRMQGMNPDNPGDIRTAALYMQEHFFDGVPASDRPPAAPIKATQQVPATARVETELPVIINAPLDFELAGLDATHPYLIRRGFEPETIAHFGLGFCSKGLMKDRIAIPLHDQSARLIGYAGRVVDDSQISEETPKYKFPGRRERQGKAFEFHKSLFLYNGFALGSGLDELIIVEGFASVWWLWQCGISNVGALMGASCSKEQGTLIVDLVKPDGKIWLLPDGDEAAIRCAHDVFEKVSPHRFVRWIPLAQARQPTDCTRDELDSLMQVGRQK